MSTSDSELLKGFKTVISIEDNSLGIYLEFARQTRDITGKNMFIQLALDEQEHRNILVKQLDKVLDTINKTGFWFGIPEFQMDGKF